MPVLVLRPRALAFVVQWSWGLPLALGSCPGHCLGGVRECNAHVLRRTLLSDTGQGFWHIVLVGLIVAAPIGLSPLHLLILCGSQRVLVVSLGGEGGELAPRGFWPTPPPTRPDQKIFPHEKNEIYQRGRSWRSILGTQIFFWPLV